MSNKFGSAVEVCCHTVEFRYWDFDHEITENLKALLTEHAEERAKQCIVEGCSSGELNYYHPHANEGEEIRGWWEIAS